VALRLRLTINVRSVDTSEQVRLEVVVARVRRRVDFSRVEEVVAAAA